MRQHPFVFLLLSVVIVNIDRSIAQQNHADIKSITIVNVERELDISSHIVKETLKYEIENADKSAVTYFVQAVENDKAQNLAVIEATFTSGSVEKKRGEKVNVSGRPQNETYFRINLPEPLNSGKKLKFSVYLEYTKVLRPFPVQIMQKDQQFVKYIGNQYVNSAYQVKKQTTTLKLSPGSVEYYSKFMPVKQDGNKIVYGPYENVEAFKTNEMVIHYENNSPFLLVTKLTRIVEVSHWGNIAVEEILEIVHTGAVLKGSFSRFDFQRDPRTNEKQPCIKSFKTILPASAKDVYYRDEIGNISTSNLRQRVDAVELEIRPRFPLFGGWKTNYYIGYNVPSYEYLYASGNKFGLKMRFIDHIYDNFVVDEMTLKIILPEGSKDFEFIPPFPVKRLPNEMHYTYLDVNGRPVISAQMKNLVENHIQDFQLYYTFDRMSMIREPLMIVAAFFILFFMVIVYVRLDFTIAKENTVELQKQKSTVASEQRSDTTTAVSKKPTKSTR